MGIALLHHHDRQRVLPLRDPTAVLGSGGFSSDRQSGPPSPASPAIRRGGLRAASPAAIGLLLAVLLSAFHTASAEDAAAPEMQPVTAELIAEHASIQLGGQTRIGVHFDIEDGWHIYAKDPGDAGLPTTIAWSAPAGVTFGPLWWPTPEKFVDPGDIHTFGYTGALVLYSPLKLNASKKDVQRLPITAKVKWLACKQICLPGSAELHLTLPVSSNVPVHSPHTELFDQVAE